MHGGRGVQWGSGGAARSRCLAGARRRRHEGVPVDWREPIRAGRRPVGDLRRDLERGNDEFCHRAAYRTAVGITRQVPIPQVNGRSAR